jgi:hypothetical protein
LDLGPVNAWGSGLDWQPIVRKEFPRPKGATPFRASLVTAFRRCHAPNRTHGPPLAEESCNPPLQYSDHVTVGSPDTNGAAANSAGTVRFDALVGNPFTAADEADVAMTLTVTDVRCTGTITTACGDANAAAGPDYTGELVAAAFLRITDEHNGPFPDLASGRGPATMQDTSVSFAAACEPTPSTSIGSTCAVTTTGDALVPGLVREKDRALWQLGEILVFDGGPDGDSTTATDTDIFLVQGVFVP